jgi:Flp pilus assembly pilin Flp
MMPSHAAALPLRRLLRDSRDGVTAITFGLLLLPTLVAVGVGVDAARIYTAKLRFDAAFDNAATALRASAASESAATLRARMQAYLDLGNPSAAAGAHVALRMSDPLRQVVVIDASAAVPTTLMQLAGVKSLPLHAAAQIVRQHPPGSQDAAEDDGDDGDAQAEEEQRRSWRPDRRGLWLRGDFHGK